MAQRQGRLLAWFRRDLRLDDNAALGHALAKHGRVFCAFVFDTEILDALESRAERRVDFIWRSVRELRENLRAAGGDLFVLHGCAQPASASSPSRTRWSSPRASCLPRADGRSRCSRPTRMCG